MRVGFVGLGWVATLLAGLRSWSDEAFGPMVVAALCNEFGGQAVQDVEL